VMLTAGVSLPTNSPAAVEGPDYKAEAAKKPAP